MQRVVRGVLPRRDPQGQRRRENRAFTLDVSLNACASAYRRMQLDAVCDCYSTSYECKPTVRQVPLLRLIDTVDETCMYKETLDLPPDAGQHRRRVVHGGRAPPSRSRRTAPS